MTTNRREFLVRGAGAAALGAFAAPSPHEQALTPPSAPPLLDYRPVVTPNGATLSFHLVDGKKIFHLVAEPVDHVFTKGLNGKCWGYNGRVHGPTIEAVEGDHVRIYVTNKLPVPTTTHWHGLFVPNGMDGVGGLSQRPIHPGETFRYEFPLRQHGTYMYHSHHDEMVQMAMGLMGMIVIHPKTPTTPPPDRDFVFLLSEWALDPGTHRPDPNEMTDFNVLTLNGKVFPETAPMVVRKGDRVRMRIGNLSGMDHHPMHLHGHSFRIVETDGGPIPLAGQWPETTVLVPTGSTRTVDFIADNPGDWAMHCHMTHHVMTQMGHGIPNLIGLEPGEFDAALTRTVPAFSALTEALMSPNALPGSDLPRNSQPMMGGMGPFGYITMGGMFTLLKVREQLTSDADPGWYENPEGTVADVASAEDLRRDGISV